MLPLVSEMDQYQTFKNDYSLCEFLSANLSLNLSATHERRSNFVSAHKPKHENGPKMITFSL